MPDFIGGAFIQCPSLCSREQKEEAVGELEGARCQECNWKKKGGTQLKGVGEWYQHDDKTGTGVP